MALPGHRADAPPYPSVSNFFSPLVNSDLDTKTSAFSSLSSSFLPSDSPFSSGKAGVRSSTPPASISHRRGKNQKSAAFASIGGAAAPNINKNDAPPSALDDKSPLSSSVAISGPSCPPSMGAAAQHALHIQLEYKNATAEEKSRIRDLLSQLVAEDLQAAENDAANQENKDAMDGGDSFNGTLVVNKKKNKNNKRGAGERSDLSSPDKNRASLARKQKTSAAASSVVDDEKKVGINGASAVNGGAAAASSASASSSSPPSSSSLPSSSVVPPPPPSPKSSAPRSYTSGNVKINIPSQWKNKFDDCGVEIIFSKADASHPLTSVGHVFRSIVAVIAAKNARSPGEQSPMWYDLLCLPKWGARKGASFKKLFEKGGWPLQVEAVIPVVANNKRRQQKPARPRQRTLEQMGMQLEEKVDQSSPLYQQVNRSSASQLSAREGELRFRVVFPTTTAADAAEEWIKLAAESALLNGVVIGAKRNTIPLQCIEIAFDAPSISEAIFSDAPSASIEDLVVDELKELGVIVTPDQIVVLNRDNQCAAPMRSKYLSSAAGVKFRCRPRVLIPLHCAAQLGSHGSSFFIRTVAKRMCNGCGPASISLRSWCKGCTEKKRAILLKNPAAPVPVYCYRCKCETTSDHISACIAAHAGQSFSCAACNGNHRSPICPGILRPLADTALGHRLLGLAPSKPRQPIKNKSRGAHRRRRLPQNLSASSAPAPAPASVAPIINNGEASYAQVVAGRGQQSSQAASGAPPAAPVAAAAAQPLLVEKWRLERLEATVDKLQQQITMLTESLNRILMVGGPAAILHNSIPPPPSSSITVAAAPAVPLLGKTKAASKFPFLKAPFDNRYSAEELMALVGGDEFNEGFQGNDDDDDDDEKEDEMSDGGDIY